MESELLKILSEQLRTIAALIIEEKTREQKGVTLTALAETVGVTKQAMSGYEKGMYIPSAIILGAIADALECSTDFLLGRV